MRRWTALAFAACAVVALLAVATSAVDVATHGTPRRHKRLLPAKLLKKPNTRPVIVPKGSLTAATVAAATPAPSAVPVVPVAPAVPAVVVPAAPAPAAAAVLTPDLPVFPVAAVGAPATPAPALVPASTQSKPAAAVVPPAAAIVPPAVPAAAAAAAASTTVKASASISASKSSASASFTIGAAVLSGAAKADAAAGNPAKAAASASTAKLTEVSGVHPTIQAVTFQTMDGLPLIVNDPNAKETDFIVPQSKLDKFAANPNPTIVTIEKPAYNPATGLNQFGIKPGTAPLKPKLFKVNAPLPTKPVTTTVLKLGAKAGDNPCVRQGGQCQDTKTCGGTVTKLLCPGPPSITCCTYTTPACAAAGGSCRDKSACAGSLVAGKSCGESGDVVCCQTGIAGLMGPVLPTIAGNCLQNFNGQAFADKAKSFLKDYNDQSEMAKKADAMAAQLGLPARVTRTDPASLIVSVMDNLGWGCRFNAASGRTVSDIIAVINTKPDQFHPIPKVGDVALWKQSTGIVVAICVGGQLELITASPAFDNKSPAVVKSTGCMPLAALKNANPDFVGFWTPQ